VDHDNDRTLADRKRKESDEELAGRILRGDEEAFALLVERYHPRIFRLVHGILGDWHASEDVCQEIFTIVFRKLDGFRHRSLLGTWIYRVSVNAALKARKRGRNPVSDSTDVLDTLASPEDSRPRNMEGGEVFRKLLQPLPENLRVAVTLREQLGLTYEEIAKVLGCSRGAVEQRLHRAMVALRQIWKKADWLDR
jgi:RNA polymerase sigma-70 factor (ECF subfamily)